jgi:hypothetical protein
MLLPSISGVKFADSMRLLLQSKHVKSTTSHQFLAFMKESPQAENSGQEPESFISEIGEIYEKEVREKQSAHLLNSDFNPRDLTLDDKSIWEKIKDKSITKADFAAYERNILDPKTRGARKDMPYSRYIFSRFVGNMATPIIGAR